MRRRQVCMGSACHLKGAPLVAQALQNELLKRGLDEEVDFELTGAFCQSQCLEGVVVKIDGEAYTKVRPSDAARILDEAGIKGE